MHKFCTFSTTFTPTPALNELGDYYRCCISAEGGKKFGRQCINYSSTAFSAHFTLCGHLCHFNSLLSFSVFFPFLTAYTERCQIRWNQQIQHTKITPEKLRTSHPAIRQLRTKNAERWVARMNTVTLIHWKRSNCHRISMQPNRQFCWHFQNLLYLISQNMVLSLV